MKDLKTEITENDRLRKEWWEIVCKHEKEIDGSKMLTEIVTIGNSLMASSFRVCYISATEGKNGNDK